MRTLRSRRHRHGYVMVIALVMFGVLMTVGVMTLTISGADQRIAYHQQRYLQARYAAMAGLAHGRLQLMFNTPAQDGWSTSPGYAPTDPALQVDGAYRDGSDWSPAKGPMVPNYQAYYRYERCSSAPPGYSAELGSSNEFRTDYWRIVADAEYDASVVDQVSRARVRALVGKVVKGSCKVR